MKLKVLSLSGVSVLVLFMFFLSACDASETERAKKPSPVQTISDAAKPVKVPDADSESPDALDTDPFVEAIEKKEVVLSYYNAKGRRDPFQSIVNSQGLGRKASIFGSLPPLQRKDISDLKYLFFAGSHWHTDRPQSRSHQRDHPK